MKRKCNYAECKTCLEVCCNNCGKRYIQGECDNCKYNSPPGLIDNWETIESIIIDKNYDYGEPPW